MSIQRAQRPDSGFTLILDEVLRDSRLSYRARGVLAAILSRPDNWVTTAEQLAAEGKEGRDAIRNALKELDEAGYIERRKEQVERGRWTTQTIVYDRPRTAPAPMTEKASPAAGKASPETENQSSADQPSDDQALRRTTEKKTKDEEPSMSPTADAVPDEDADDLPASSKKEGPVEPPRDDVDRLCTYLADRIEENGSKRPTIRIEWRRQCRLLLDRDNRTEAQVRAAIDWCQNDPFWRANIQSMPKLREQYDTLRLRAIEQAQAHVRSQANQRQNRTNQLFDAAMERARARDAATSVTVQPEGALNR